MSEPTLALYQTVRHDHVQVKRPFPTGFKHSPIAEILLFSATTEGIESALKAAISSDAKLVLFKEDISERPALEIAASVKKKILAGSFRALYVEITA